MTNDGRKWANYFANPLGQGVKKFFYDLLGPERYPNHEVIIEQVSRVIYNEKDYENLGKCMAEIYEAGFMRAVEEQKAELTRLGLKVNMLKAPEKKEGKSIF
jgi:hypothetical protein